MLGILPGSRKAQLQPQGSGSGQKTKPGGAPAHLQADCKSTIDWIGTII